MNQSQIAIYTNSNGDTKIQVHLEDETVWLAQEQICLLYGKARRTIGEHIQNIFAEGELDKKLARRNFRHTTQHGAIKGNLF